jgi:hypothetical protein
MGVTLRHGRWREVLGMQRLRLSSEAEMVELFLRTELGARSLDDLRVLLRRIACSIGVVTAHDLGDRVAR